MENMSETQEPKEQSSYESEIGRMVNFFGEWLKRDAPEKFLDGVVSPLIELFPKILSKVENAYSKVDIRKVEKAILSMVKDTPFAGRFAEFESKGDMDGYQVFLGKNLSEIIDSLTIDADSINDLRSMPHTLRGLLKAGLVDDRFLQAKIITAHLACLSEPVGKQSEEK